MSDQTHLAGKYVEVDIDLIDPNPWNPNEMDAKTFNRLTAEIQETGMIDPIQLVQMDTGRYRILGGEHRWRAMQVLGYAKCPSILLASDKWKDGDLQKFVTTRLNALRGKLNPEKFMKMYSDLSTRYSAEDMASLMGFTDEDTFNKMTGQVAQSMRDAGLSESAITEMEKKAASLEIKTVEGLSDILNRLFTQHGSTLDHHFMWFDFGGKDHLYVQVTKPAVWKRLKMMIGTMHSRGIDAEEAFDAFARKWEGVVDVQSIASNSDSGEAVE